MDEVRRRCLLKLPDLPIWIETRTLLMREYSKLREHSSQSGIVVWSMEDGLGSVVGESATICSASEP